MNWTLVISWYIPLFLSLCGSISVCKSSRKVLLYYLVPSVSWLPELGFLIGRICEYSYVKHMIHVENAHFLEHSKLNCAFKVQP